MAIFLKVLALILALIAVNESAVYIADQGMSKMLELNTRGPFCQVHRDRGTIRNKMLASDPQKVLQISDNALEQLEDVCKRNQVTSAHQGGFIYPGTKWCGPGTIAADDEDLGYHRKEDVCCREHDKCPKHLLRGECSRGICNTSPFTRSHCDCDATFRRCLQNANTETANTIGAIFFNVVQVICFKERSPCSQQQNSTMDSTMNDSSCNLVFTKSDRYIASKWPMYRFRYKKEFFLSLLLRKFGNGYTKNESDILCAQWNFMPSEKYVPLMPLS